MVRVRADLEEMIRWITRIQGKSSSEILDPLIRKDVTERYTKILPLIQQIQAAEEEARLAAVEADERVESVERRAKMLASGQPTIFDGLDLGSPPPTLASSSAEQTPQKGSDPKPKKPHKK